MSLPPLTTLVNNPIDHLAALGEIRLNYPLGEEMALASQNWLSVAEGKQILEGLRNRKDVFGDLYVRFTAGT